MVKILLAGFVVSIVWFIVGAILYMNPFCKKIQDSLSKHPGVKKWAKSADMLLPMYFLGCLIPSIIFAFIYWKVSPVICVTKMGKILGFGCLLVGVKIYPRLADMALMSSYPKELLIMDVINGSIASFAVAATLAFMI